MAKAWARAETGPGSRRHPPAGQGPQAGTDLGRAPGPWGPSPEKQGCLGAAIQAIVCWFLLVLLARCVDGLYGKDFAILAASLRAQIIELVDLLGFELARLPPQRKDYQYWGPKSQSGIQSSSTSGWIGRKPSIG